VIAEGIDTAVTLGWALAAWIVLVSLTAALALHTALVAVWWAGRAVWRAVRALWPRRGVLRGLGAPEGPSRGSRAVGGVPEASQSRSRRRAPSWAHTQPLDHEEAA